MKKILNHIIAEILTIDLCISPLYIKGHLWDSLHIFGDFLWDSTGLIFTLSLINEMKKKFNLVSGSSSYHSAAALTMYALGPVGWEEKKQEVISMKLLLKVEESKPLYFGQEEGMEHDGDVERRDGEPGRPHSPEVARGGHQVGRGESQDGERARIFCSFNVDPL